MACTSTQRSRPVAADGSRAGIAVVAEGVTVVRGRRTVVQAIDLQVAPGEVVALVGRSGVGKTSLLSTLNGLIRPAAGTIAMAGLGPLVDRHGWAQARRRMATVFQHHALIDRLPALDNVLLGLADRRHPLSPLPWPFALRDRAARALAEVDLLDKATTPAGRLSGGERQRVGIARALVRGPELLICDEPFSSVDPMLAGELAGLMLRLARERGTTVILAVHQIALARSHADRIVGLADGRIVHDGPASRFDAAAEAAVFGASARITLVSAQDRERIS